MIKLQKNIDKTIYPYDKFNLNIKFMNFLLNKNVKSTYNECIENISHLD